MAGIRIGGTTIITLCSPPFGADDQGGQNSNIWKWCSVNGPGDGTDISGFNDNNATYELAFDAVLSPDGTKILFVASSQATGYTDILVVNANGGTPLSLLQDDNNYYMTPMWGPDSDLFVCVHGTGGSFAGTIETSRVSDPGVVIDTFVTTDGTFQPCRPAYNFDGSRISYFWDKDIGSGCELRVMDADGTNDALLDTITNYRFDGAQSSWAHSSDMLIYEDGANPAAAYLINGDGTGKTQINASGDAAGVNCRIAHIAWPPADDYVIIGAQAGMDARYYPTRCELDGSGSTALETTNGAVSSIGDRQNLVYANRVWFLEQTQTVGKLGSCDLTGGDYQLNLNTSLGTTMGEIFGGWYGDTG
jgi:hypothetical protein